MWIGHDTFQLFDAWRFLSVGNKDTKNVDVVVFQRACCLLEYGGVHNVAILILRVPVREYDYNLKYCRQFVE